MPPAQLERFLREALDYYGLPLLLVALQELVAKRANYIAEQAGIDDHRANCWATVAHALDLPVRVAVIHEL